MFAYCLLWNAIVHRIQINEVLGKLWCVYRRSLLLIDPHIWELHTLYCKVAFSNLMYRVDAISRWWIATLCTKLMQFQDGGYTAVRTPTSPGLSTPYQHDAYLELCTGV